MRQRVVASLLILFVATVPSMFGQAASGTAAITGSVTDASGAVVPGTAVVVRNVDTNVARELQSNEAGAYEAAALQPGNYEVKASKAGFATLTRTGITVSVGQRAIVDIKMQVSATSENVTVSAESAVVETDKTDVSTVVNLKDIRPCCRRNSGACHSSATQVAYADSFP